MKRASIVALSLFLTLACDGDKPPTTPTPPTTPAVPIATSLGVSLSPLVQTIPPGQTAQLTATARYSDGSTKDVTSQSGWTSSQVNVARVAAGAVTGVALGQTVIRVSFERWSASTTIVIQPDGTLVLKGRVTEVGQVGVSGATVEVISGTPTQVLTDINGFYVLYGVGVTSIVRVRKTGYFDESRTVTNSGNQTLNVEITPRSAPASVAGTYRMTFTASGSCATLLGDLKTRTYTARIDQDAARLTVTLSDATFVKGYYWPGNRFEGRVFGDSVTFDLGGNYYISYYGTPVQELLPDGRIIGIWGTINAVVTPPSIIGTLAGGFALRTNRFTSCSSADSQVVFTR